MRLIDADKLETHVRALLCTPDSIEPVWSSDVLDTIRKEPTVGGWISKTAAAGVTRGGGKMPRTIGFHHGALVDSYEKQANEQGFTLGEERERLEKLGFSLVYSWIQGCLTDAQYDMALRKLQKQLAKAVRQLPELPEEDENEDAQS